MKVQTDIPKPEDSGSDGLQTKADAAGALIEPQPVGRPMAKAITGLAASNSRAFGGEVASALIAGATSQMAVELDQTRHELSEQRQKNDRLTSDLTDEKIMSAVLAERIDSFRSSRHLKNIGISVGSLILGLGVQAIRSETFAYGIAGVAIGIVLLAFSWAAVPKGGQMIVADLPELELYAVADRGLPNSERIQILVRESTEMGQFGLMVGNSGPSGFAMPLRDNLFWFGDGIVNLGDWIFVYTGNGTPRIDEWSSPPGSKIYTVHWGRNKTMFANSNIVPVLFKTGAVQVDLPPSDLPQLSGSNT